MLLLKIVEKLLDKHARLIKISNIQRLNLKLNLGLHLAGLTNSIKIKIKLYKSICKEKDNHKKNKKIMKDNSKLTIILYRESLLRESRLMAFHKGGLHAILAVFFNFISSIFHFFCFCILL